MGFVVGRELSKPCRSLGFFGIEALLELVQLAPKFLGALFLSLFAANLLDGTLNLGVAALQYLLCLGTRVVNDLSMLGTDIVQPLVIVGDHLVEAFFLGAHVLALVLPVAAVAHDVEQVLVHVDIVAAHYLAGLVDHLLRQPRLAGNLDGKRTAGITHRQLEERLHALAVIEHSAIDHAISLIGKMLQILVMGCDHTHHPVLVELLQDGLGNGSANLRLGAAAHLVDKDESLLTSLREEQLHVLQVAAIGTQVVLDALLVADVNENVMVQAHV